MSKNVGVIGLGAMGLGVARSLLRAGFKVHACDVRDAVLQQFASSNTEMVTLFGTEVFFLSFI